MNTTRSNSSVFRCRSSTARRHSEGFSYLEVMISVLLIATVLVPASDLLSSALQGSQIHEERSAAHYRLVAKMEEVLARPLPELRQQADSAGSPNVVIDAYSDSAGTYQRRLVYLSRYDADNADGDDDGFTGTEPDLFWLKVVVEGGNMRTITLAGVRR